jgi:hypothetical protein
MSLSHIFRDLVENNVADLVLDQQPEEYVEDANDLVVALKDNSSVQSIALHGEFLSGLLTRERVELLEALGDLPNLQEVFLGGSCMDVTVMTQLLRLHHANLRKLHLFGLVLQGVQEEFDELERAIREHPDLKDFEMAKCTTANASVDIKRLESAREKFMGSIENPRHVKKSAVMA